MEKEHLFRAQFNGSPGSQNNKTTVKRRKYPVSSKAEYNSISEVVEEYKSNYKTLKANIRDIVRSNPEDFDFQSMTDADSFIAVSIPIDMGDDYVAYVCTAVPEHRDCVFTISIKHFRLKGGRCQNGLGLIAPENIGNKSLAVFTDVFLQNCTVWRIWKKVTFSSGHAKQACFPFMVIMPVGCSSKEWLSGKSLTVSTILRNLRTR